MPKITVSGDYVSIDNDGRVAEVFVDSSDKNFFEQRIFIPKSSELSTIQSGNDTLWYEKEPGYSSSYYEYRCRGDECAKQKLTIRYGVDQPLTIMVVSIYDQLPEQYQYLSALKGDKVVSVHDGDKTLIISRHKL